MSLEEALSSAYESIRTNRLRAGLAVRGMTISTTSIDPVVSVLLTGRRYILDRIRRVGSSLSYAYNKAGVVFGLIPANRAAKLNPTEALHHE